MNSIAMTQFEYSSQCEISKTFLAVTFFVKSILSFRGWIHQRKLISRKIVLLEKSLDFHTVRKRHEGVNLETTSI